MILQKVVYGKLTCAECGQFTGPIFILRGKGRLVVILCLTCLRELHKVLDIDEEINP